MRLLSNCSNSELYPNCPCMPEPSHDVEPAHQISFPRVDCFWLAQLLAKHGKQLCVKVWRVISMPSD